MGMGKEKILNPNAESEIQNGLPNPGGGLIFTKEPVKAQAVF
jgi:hypothetical protein